MMKVAAVALLSLFAIFSASFADASDTATLIPNSHSTELSGEFKGLAPSDAPVKSVSDADNLNPAALVPSGETVRKAVDSYKGLAPTGKQIQTVGKEYGGLMPESAPSSKASGKSGKSAKGPTDYEWQEASQLQLFYLISKTVPETTVSNVFQQAQKVLHLISFDGVLRGLDKEMVSKIYLYAEHMKGLSIRVNPLIFKQAEAVAVPAFVYAVCPKGDFRSTDCQYKGVVYGDMTLLAAVEIMKDAFTELEPIYDTLKDIH